jgi:hypothetical protein
VAELQRADQQARHDLVADAQQQHGVEHVVRQRDGGGHRDGVAREQRQLHARRALRDAVAHRRHAAGDLHRRAERGGVAPDLLGVALVGLVRRQHVVVRRDDADVRRALGHDAQLVVGGHAGERVGDVGAAQALRAARARAQGVDVAEVVGTRAGAAAADALGDGGDGRVERLLRRRRGGVTHGLIIR